MQTLKIVAIVLFLVLIGIMPVLAQDDQAVDWEGFCRAFPEAKECESLPVVTEEANLSEQVAPCTVTGRDVNIRSNAGVDQPIIDVLDGDAEAFEHTTGTDGYVWWKIGEARWVRSDVVAENLDCPDIELTEATEATPDPSQDLVPTDVSSSPALDERRDMASAGVKDDQGNIYVAFGPGEAVRGAYIILDDGRSCNDCYTKSAPVGGRVYGGVVNPWTDEVGEVNEAFPQ